MNTAPMFNSDKDDWRTPLEFWEWVDGIFHFKADVDWSAPIIKGWPEGRDAMDRPWPRRRAMFCNPPYGRDLGTWLARGLEAAAFATVVFLLPARTDTAWFHRFAPRGEVWFLGGRLTFEGAPAPAPFPSMLVIFRPGGAQGFTRCVDWKTERTEQ